ncbi:hypothetical protein FCJ48_18310 [Salmonella enterica]|nr:hypothetical protein [Salmonella enterica]
MKTYYYISVLPFFLSSCALSEGLSPPKDGKVVTVSVVKPVDVDILPMSVIYRSKKCTDKIFTSSGEITDQDGFNRLTVPFIQDAGKNTVSNKIALSGGGSCNWQLSNIRFQFKFSNPDKFGEGIKINIPADIVFIFDDNDPPRGDGNEEDVTGDVEVKKDYYAMINKAFTDDGFDVLHISGQSMLTYRVHDVKSIFFRPNVHSDKIVNVLTPKKSGDDYVIVYPNGEKVTDHYFPYSDKTKYEYVEKKFH